MLTNDDLLAIGKLIDDKIKPLKEGQERLEAKLDESMKDNAVFFNDVGIFFDEVRKGIGERLNDHETRISQLEEGSSVPNSH